MKIHEYNEMMAYLTRPAMKTGGQVIGKPGGLVEPGVTNYGARMYAAEKAFELAPKIGSQIVKAGNYLKNLLASRPVRTGAERVQPKTDFSWDQKFATDFKEYADKYFAGNWTAASKSIGASRERIKSIFQGLSPDKRSYGNLATGTKTTPTIDISLGTKSFKDMTTDLKYKPEIKITSEIKE